MLSHYAMAGCLLSCHHTADCSNNTIIEYALSCPKGGFHSIRHNKIRDMTAKLLSEVCTDVKVEPELQPLTGEFLQHKTANMEDGARLDISASGLWGGRYEKTFVDMRVFNPHAATLQLQLTCSNH